MIAPHFKDLDCWQLAHELKLAVFAFTAKMPAKADRDFCHDIRRSARSAQANISEGFGRETHLDFANFLAIARASLMETENPTSHLAPRTPHVVIAPHLVSVCYTFAHSMFFRGQIVGKYKILSTIGSGGFGTVYLAEDTWIDKKVALKVPHKQGVDFGELLREPRLLASLNHPNIVTILTAEKQENVFFIVMEFVPGETLETIIAREGPLDVARALDYTCQISNAVDHAHRQNVLHRDLRPSNVLVADSGMLKVADFGTSRFLEIAAHGTTVIGSPPYMAPEQFHGKAVFASDIYSLGVTMYQMLTGVLPYDTPSPADLDRLMKGELLTAPRLKNPKIPKSINDIVLKAMAPDISARYQRASELLDDVLAARSTSSRRTPRTPASLTSEAAEPLVGDSVQQDIHLRLKAREAPQPRFCWHCRKPLHARSDRCPFCGEAQ
jgi:serine/threonine protein kinase